MVWLIMEFLRVISMEKLKIILNFIGYIGIIIVLAYYLYLINQPQKWVCETFTEKMQVCTVYNLIGNK